MQDLATHMEAVKCRCLNTRYLNSYYRQWRISHCGQESLGQLPKCDQLVLSEMIKGIEVSALSGWHHAGPMETMQTDLQLETTLGSHIRKLLGLHCLLVPVFMH